MKRLFPLRLIAIFLCCLFIAFITIHLYQVKNDIRTAVEQHAKVVSTSLWDLNQSTQAEYLNIVAEHYNYETISVFDHDDQIFLSANTVLDKWHERILLSLGLISRVRLTTPIIYRGQKIGAIKAVWYNKAIYRISYIFLILLLVLTVLYFYNRLLKSNLLLEARVEERTEEIKENERKYRLLADNSVDVIWTMDRSRNLTYISPSIKQLRGYTVEEAMAEPLEEKFVPSVREAVLGYFAQATESIEPVFFETEQPCKDGSTVWVEVSVRKLIDEFGNHIGLIGTSRNITERKQAEDALRESENRFKVLSEESPFGLSLIDQQGRYLYINPSFIKIFGYTPQEFTTGMEWFNLAFPDEENRKLIIKTWKDDLAGNRRSESRRRIYDVTCKDGSIKTIMFRPVTTASHGQLVLYEDITDRKRAEEEKQKLQAQLQQTQKLEAIGTLAGGIAHDFNNILSGIIGFSEVALMNYQLNQEVEEHIEQVINAGIRARDLVKHILAFSRQVDKQITTVKLEPLIKEIQKFLRASLAANIDIKTSLQVQDDVILADPTQVHQVLLNLCTNASHSMESRGGVLGVDLSEVIVDEGRVLDDGLLSPGKYLRLSVSDTGKGIPKELKDRIFDPFFTTKERGEGTGLGLSVVHGIVKEIGGAISVYSEQDIGTTFNIFLPQKDITEVDDNALPQFLHFGKGRILVVDDEESIATISKALLENVGYEVTAETSSVRAIELFEANADDFDLVVTDLSMPQINGLELSRRLKQIRKNIPIILATGFGSQISNEAIENAGIFKMIMKPVIAAELTGVIKEALENQV